MDDTKIIVTHKGALEAKYGAAASRVLAAIGRLISADAARGIGSRLVALDSKSDMAAYHARPMRGPADEEGAKRCIDAIDKAIEPHYILIVGGPDVVPMQDLQNPAGVLVGKLNEAPDNGDDDPNLPSDLPYACDAPWSRDPGDFQGPTRVVGRLPDVPKEKDPAFLVKLLKLAAEARPLPRKDYEAWFALSAKVWETSSSKTVKKIFGDTSRLVFSPPKKNLWSAQELSPRLHYINCHGGNRAVEFLGQFPPDGDVEGEQTLAMRAPALRGKVARGTVVAAECCFGAQVFSPRKKDGAEVNGTLGIALEYLRQGAYGVFGSTNIAYGPPGDLDNDNADVICRKFMERVRAGCSLGRAALEARVAYVKYDPWTDPVKLKTLAQFTLLGDPSIHPVAPEASRPSPRERRIEVNPEVERRYRAYRRKKAREEGLALDAAKVVLKDELAQIPAEVQQQIWAMAEKLGMRSKMIRTLSLWAGAKAVAGGDKSASAANRARRVGVLIGMLDPKTGEGDAAKGRKAFRRYCAVIARMEGSKVVTKYLVSR